MVVYDGPVFYRTRSFTVETPTVGCEVAIVEVAGPDGESLPTTTTTSETLLIFTAAVTGGTETSTSPALVWQLDAPSLGQLDVPLTESTTGVLPSANGRVLVVDFEELEVEVAGVTRELFNQSLTFEARADPADDPEGDCTVARRNIFVERTCAVTITSPGEEPSAVATTTIDLVADLSAST